ncbi:50S ribosomal protein L29 [Candidatus Dependentiae bacterium]|nr:50S ribosomal protein L29 [Candidatus Dependentiae bacterium]
MTMAKNELDFKNMSGEDLYKYVEAQRAELFSLRLSAATQPTKDYSQFKKLRKNIARGLTQMRDKSEQLG